MSQDRKPFYPITPKTHEDVAFSANIIPYVSDSIEMVFKYIIMMSFGTEAKEKYELYDSPTYFTSEQDAEHAANEHIASIHKSEYNLRDLVDQINKRKMSQ